MRRLDPLALSNLSLPAKWLGAFMLRHANRNGEVVTTISDITDWTALGKTAIRDAIDALQRKRFILVLEPFKPGPNSSARFAVVGGDSARSGASRTEITHDAPQLVSGDAKTGDSLASARRSSPPLSTPSESLSSPVLENKQLGMESVSETPAWLADLRTAPGYDIDRVHEMKLIDRVRDAGISPARLCETAAAIAAKWDSIKYSPSNKGGYKKIDLTFIAWAKRESFNGAKSTNGRYVAPGTSIPKGGTPEAHARWPEQTYDDDGNVLTTRW